VVRSSLGRIETRRCWATSDIAWLDPEGRWPKLTSMAMLEATRDIGEHTTTDGRFFITTLPADAPTILHAVRAHWGIESAPQAHGKEARYELTNCA
jgi:hypothetical protein